MIPKEDGVGVALFLEVALNRFINEDALDVDGALFSVLFGKLEETALIGLEEVTGLSLF